MHVLFISAEFPPMQGGVGDCTNEIALALTKRGVQVSVLTTDAVPSVPRPPSSVLRILRTIKKWDWSALSQIRRTIEETKPDIYHIQYQTGAFGMHPMINFAPRLLASTKINSAVTFHDLRPMYLFPKAGPLRDWVTFQLAQKTDAVIATNQEDYTRLATRHLQNLSLIPIGSNINPTPPPDFDPGALREELGIEPDEILLCYFGFLNESKGGETLLRALAEMPNAKLVMLGGQTGETDATNISYLARVRKLIDDLELTDRVIWTDFLDPPEVSAHFLASDMCVLPYRDGASYRRGTFMAALAHGMAIVTTDDGRQPADDGRLPALRNGENVVLVPPDDPGAIVEAVNRIASNPTLRAQLQQRARETAQFFTWDKIADAHLELYSKLLSSSPLSDL